MVYVERVEAYSHLYIDNIVPVQYRATSSTHTSRPISIIHSFFLEAMHAYEYMQSFAGIRESEVRYLIEKRRRKVNCKRTWQPFCSTRLVRGKYC